MLTENIKYTAAGKRFAIRCTVLAAILLVCLSNGCSRGGGKDYNVLIVTLDTTRRDHLGCYGKSPLTPNLDAFAADGVRFDMAISTSGATPIAHASIMTGLNPYDHGVRVIYAESGYRLRESVPTLAELLREGSWKTGAFLSSFTVSSFFGFNRGFEVFSEGLQVPPDQSFARQNNGFWGWPVHLNQRRSDETTNETIAWIENTNERFFAWVHYWDPHDSRLVPPDSLIARFVTRDMDEETVKRRLYQAEVLYIDTQFGRLIQTLKQQGVYDNTIIVVVGDHGEGLGNHGWWHHRILYQEQIQIPLLMRVPGWPTGVVVQDLIRNIDVTPTILKALDLETPAKTTGLDVAPLVHGESEPSPRVAYADAINIFDLNAGLVDQRPDDALLFCATDGRWKLIHRPLIEGKDELYDLVSDPTEQVNLFSSQPEQVERLKSRLDAFNGYVDKPFGNPTDEKVIERLKSLGYM